MSTVSSRTPGGEPAKCPICGHVFSALPSQPLRDTTCPNCGCLLVIEEQAGYVEVIAIVGPTRVAGEADTLPPDDRYTITEIAEITPGKIVRIAGGTFSGFVARVKSIDVAASTATVEIPVFGRVTTVTVTFADIVGQ